MKFISKYKNQVLTMIPDRMQVIDGIAIPVPGKHIRFEGGAYETDAKEEVDYIRNHRFFGTRIFEEKQTRKGNQE